MVGYLSTPCRLGPPFGRRPRDEAFVTHRFWAELQIRTEAQHLWSDMSHHGFYKNDATLLSLSSDVQRRVNLMAGQIEVADREFERLRGETPVSDEAKLFQFLEPLYYQLTSRRPDTELSLSVLRLLLPLFRMTLPQIEGQLMKFFGDRKAFLMERYRQVQELNESSSSPLLFQPEAIVLYERLLADEIGLRRTWNTEFP